ncbi:MAG TPA: hypothetical protein VIG88_12785 [Lysobacter sp.]
MSDVRLPTDAIRACIAASDFEGAHALLADHETALRAAFEDGSAAEKGCRESWLELLAAQRALIDELRTTRDEAAAALDRAGHDRRAVNAYLQSGG